MLSIDYLFSEFDRSLFCMSHFEWLHLLLKTSTKQRPSCWWPSFSLYKHTIFSFEMMATPHVSLLTWNWGFVSPKSFSLFFVALCKNPDMGVSLNGGIPKSPPKWSFAGGKPMGLLWKPTILGFTTILYSIHPWFSKTFPENLQMNTSSWDVRFFAWP